MAGEKSVTDADFNLPSSVASARLSGDKFYYTGKPCKHGHVSKRMTSTGVCMHCKKIESLSDSNKKRRQEWRANNKDLYRKKKREYYQKNRARELARDRKRYQKNKERKISYQKRYTEENRSKVLASKREYHNRMMRECRLYVISKRIRSLIWASLGQKKSVKTEKIVGCSLEEFKRHIERQFTKGMSWEKMSDIHIDHIVPLSSAKTESEVLALNHYTNLRPLWAYENLSKGSKMEYLL